MVAAPGGLPGGEPRLVYARTTGWGQSHAAELHDQARGTFTAASGDDEPGPAPRFYDLLPTRFCGDLREGAGVGEIAEQHDLPVAEPQDLDGRDRERPAGRGQGRL